jgi:hypothetical protein
VLATYADIKSDLEHFKHISCILNFVKLVGDYDNSEQIYQLL